MTPTDKTAPSQTEAISFEFDLHHPPEKVWRALTDPDLLAEWLLPVVDLKLEPGAEFTFKAQPYPGWDGTVNCRFIEIETQEAQLHVDRRRHRHRGDVHAQPTASGTRLSLVQSGFKPDQKQDFGGARYGWKLMGGKLVDLLARLP